MEGEKIRSHRKMVMPQSGLINKDGVLFYHTNRSVLLPAHRERIASCGITLRSGRFYPEEDDTIRNNWRRYAEKNDISLDRGYEFGGGLVEIMSKEDVKELHDFQEKTSFIPSLCKDLPCRTGKQVIVRLRDLFHPKNVGNGASTGIKERKTKYTDEEVRLLEGMLKQGKSLRQISYSLGRTRHSIASKVGLLSVSARRDAYSEGDEWSDDARFSLYEEVNKWLSRKRFREEFWQYMPEKVTWNAADLALFFANNEEMAEKSLPWDKMSMSMDKTVDDVKNQWKKELKRLQDACAIFYGDTAKATDSCRPKLRTITASEFYQALVIIKGMKPTLLRDVPDEVLQNELSKNSLLGYYRKQTSEAAYIKKLLSRYVEFIRTLLPVRPGNRITFLQWLELLITALGACNPEESLMLQGKIFRASIRDAAKQNTADFYAGLVAEEKRIVTIVENEKNAFTERTGLRFKEEDEYCNDMKIPKISTSPLSFEERKANNNGFQKEYSATQMLTDFIEGKLIPKLPGRKRKKYLWKYEEMTATTKMVTLELLQSFVIKLLRNFEGKEQIRLTKKYAKILRKAEKVNKVEDVRVKVKSEPEERHSNRSSANVQN